MPRGFAAITRRYAVPMMGGVATRCRGKIIFPTAGNADAASVELRALGAATQAYACPYGAHWHLTSDLETDIPESVGHRKRKFATRGKRRWPNIKGKTE